MALSREQRVQGWMDIGLTKSDAETEVDRQEQEFARIAAISQQVQKSEKEKADRAEGNLFDPYKNVEAALEARNSELEGLRQAEEKERELGNEDGADAIARMIRQHTPKVNPAHALAYAESEVDLRKKWKETGLTAAEYEIAVKSGLIEKTDSSQEAPITIERKDLAFLLTWAKAGIDAEDWYVEDLRDALTERLDELKGKL